MMLNTLKCGKQFDSTILGEMHLPRLHKSQDNSEHRHQTHAVNGTAFTPRCPYFA